MSRTALARLQAASAAKVASGQIPVDAQQYTALAARPATAALRLKYAGIKF